MSTRTPAAVGRVLRPAATERRLELVVDGGPLYWLRLAVKPTATLADLDRFLRAHWLDCCEHLSAFTIRGEEFAVETAGGGLRARLCDVVTPDERFAYVYDFRNATALVVHVVGERRYRAGRAPVRLVAENAPPHIVCDGCGGHASHVCSACTDDERGWLCARCAALHPCSVAYLLPIVNSPRTGVCAYGRARRA